MYILKNDLDLSVSGEITDKVKIQDGKLIILENSDVIELNIDDWYINNFYQGKDAKYYYRVENPIIRNKELFGKFFKEE